jgi:hypothetical protein
MKSLPNANQLRGRAIGSIFFACFGAGWLFLSLAAKQMLTFATVSGTLLGMLVLLLAALYLIRQSKRWPRVLADPNMGRAFARINAIQWTAVFAAAFTLGKLHLDAYTTSAITAIVGMHMFPLARLFRYPLHYATGTLLVAWAAASSASVRADEMQGVTAMGTGAILWLSAAVTLAIALRAATQQPEQPLACQRYESHWLGSVRSLLKNRTQTLCNSRPPALPTHGSMKPGPINAAANSLTCYPA